MAQAGFTPIQLYVSTTPGMAPTAGNLAAGELAINTTDGRLFYKDTGGTVRILAGTGGSGVVAGANTQLQFNNNGVFGASAGLTWDGSFLTATSLRSSALTSGRLTFAGASGVLQDAAGLTWDGSFLTASSIKNTALSSGRLTYAGAAGLLQDSANLTFDGTTLTAAGLATAGALTLSGGTANGVPYLNASKVLTSGTALTFDGTNLGVGSAAGATSGRSIDLNGVTLQPLVTLRASSQTSATTTWTLDTGNNLVSFDSSANWPFRWTVNGSEQMRLTSTGLGIGTSNPVSKLDVAETVTIKRVTSGNNMDLNFYNGSGVATAGNVARIRADGDGISNDYGALSFWTGRINSAAITEKMRLDSLGNLGLGVTPSAWGAVKAIESAFGNFAGVNQFNGTANAWYNGGNWVYKNTAAATQYLQISGAHQWLTAPSGTAGNAISFTQAMTLDASGNLGVGTTSATARLDVYNASNDVYMALRTGSAEMTFNTGTGFTGSTATSIWNKSAIPMVFGTNNAERARIDSSGNLLVGTTSNTTGSPRMYVVGARAAIFQSSQANTGSTQTYCTSANNDEPSVLAGNNSSASSGVGTFYSSLGSGNGSQSNTNCYHLKAVTQGVGINYLYGNGTTSFTSDARLKKNITSTRDGYAEDLCKLRVVKYNWNTAPEGEAQELGLIAQEVEQVFPGLVQDADTEIQGFTPKVLKGSVLPFMLLKAIQEQQAIIEQLKARLDAANL